MSEENKPDNTPEVPANDDVLTNEQITNIESEIAKLDQAERTKLLGTLNVSHKVELTKMKEDYESKLADITGQLEESTKGKAEIENKFENYAKGLDTKIDGLLKIMNQKASNQPVERQGVSNTQPNPFKEPENKPNIPEDPRDWAKNKELKAKVKAEVLGQLGV